MVAQFVRGLIQGHLRARSVAMFGPSDVDAEKVWSDSGPWSYAVRRAWRLC